MGAAQPPEMSFGVMRAGTLPRSTLGGVGLAGAGSEAAQALLSLPVAQGSKRAVVFELANSGMGDGVGAGRETVGLG